MDGSRLAKYGRKVAIEAAMIPRFNSSLSVFSAGNDSSSSFWVGALSRLYSHGEHDVD